MFIGSLRSSDNFQIHITNVLIGNEILGSLPQEKLDGIRAWKFTLTEDDENLLTETGKMELFELGQRYQKRLPSLFEPPRKVMN